MNVDIARSWLGTPFKHQGRVKGIGVDCAGLAVGIARDHKAAVIDVTGYPRLPNSDDMQRMLDKQCETIAAMEVGAILFMPHTGPRCLSLHLAIVTKVDPVYIIHAYQPAGKVIEHRLDSKWLRRVAKIYRFRPWLS